MLFVLGLGMALPWPFAGAGLSFLPKPGKWMKGIKYAFGVLILLFAGYYGHLAVNLYSSASQLHVSTRETEGAAEGRSSDETLARALKRARTVPAPT